MVPTPNGEPEAPTEPEETEEERVQKILSSKDVYQRIVDYLRGKGKKTPHEIQKQLETGECQK
jgi:hypothetical protein